MIQAGPLGALYAKLLWEIVSLTADGIVWFILFPLLGSVILERYLWGYNLARLVGVGLLVDIVVIIAPKQVFKRARPVYHGADFRFVGPDQFSFPSGHATRAWLFLGLAMNSSEAAPSLNSNAVMIAGWASVVTLGRVALGRHYATDVICGALIGALVSAPIAGILYERIFTYFSSLLIVALICSSCDTIRSILHLADRHCKHTGAQRVTGLAISPFVRAS